MSSGFEVDLRVQLAHTQAVLDRVYKVADVTVAQVAAAEQLANDDGYSLETLYLLAELDEGGESNV